MSRMCLSVALLLATGLAGCASAPPDDTERRIAAATAAFGGSYRYQVIKSAGSFKDGAYVTSSKLTGPQQLALDLSKLIAPAETESVRLLVTGPDGQKNVQVIRDAFSLYDGRALPNLEFLYLGQAEQETPIREIVESHGARFRFAPFP